MSGNFYGYVLSIGRIERYLINISDDQEVTISTTNENFKGNAVTRKIKDGKGKYLVLETESYDSKKNLNIIIKVGDSIKQKILLGIWSRMGERFSIIAGRIVLTRVQLKPKGGTHIHIDNENEVEELTKREEWLSIQSIIDYLQSGTKPPTQKEISDLKNEIENLEKRYKNRIKDLEDKQKEILKELEEKSKKVFLSITDYKNLLRKGNLDEIFDGILIWLDSKEKSDVIINEIVVLNSRWSFIQKESRLGTISFEEKMLSRNKICVGLLEIIERIEKNTGWNKT